MPKKKISIKKVTAKNLEDDYLEIVVEDSKGEIHSTRSKKTSDGRIRFSMVHPTLNKKLPYDGIVDGSYLYLYPLIGVGVLTDQRIRID